MPIGPLGSWWFGDEAEGVSDRDGRFELAGLEPGAIRLRFEAPDLAPRVFATNVAGFDGVVDLGELGLEPGGQLQIEVASLGEGEITTAYLDFTGSGADSEMIIVPINREMTVIPNVPSGSLEVSLREGRKSRCHEVVAIETRQTSRLQCENAGIQLVGEVLLGGGPSGAGWLHFLPEDEPRVPAVIVNRVDHGLRHQTVLGRGRPQVDVPVEAGGRFSADQMPKGRYSVAFESSEGGWTAQEFLEVHSGERQETVLEFSSMAVRGRVNDGRGKPVKGATVSDLDGRAVTLSSDEGLFELTGLSAPSVRLRARLEDRVGPVTFVDLTEAAETEVLLLVDGEVGFQRVQISLASGEPAVGAVVAFKFGAAGPAVLSADDRGMVSFDLEGMNQQVRAAATTSEGWVLGESQAASDEVVHLTSSETGSLRLTSGPPGAAPRLTSAEGWNITELLTVVGLPHRFDSRGRLEVPGLPVGRYEVEVAGSSRAVMVTAGDQVTLDFENGDN
jgi:hypothetical protein